MCFYTIVVGRSGIFEVGKAVTMVILQHVIDTIMLLCACCIYFQAPNPADDAFRVSVTSAQVEVRPGTDLDIIAIS